jgi:endonuclease-3
MSELSSTEQARVARILETLNRLYPDATCALRYSNPLELLVATILSAQCTDERVNKVTRELFARCRTPEDYLALSQEELEQAIRSTGFFRNKAKSIRGCCQALLERHGGQVPRTMEELVALPGVARKTANVVLGNAFGVPGITVDTHVKRLSRRLGLSQATQPEKIERDLMRLVPRERWTLFSHQMIFHGRQVCHSRKPACERCELAPECPSRVV